MAPNRRELAIERRDLFGLLPDDNGNDHTDRQTASADPTATPAASAASGTATSPPASSTSTNANSGPPGILGGISSGIGDLTSGIGQLTSGLGSIVPPILPTDTSSSSPTQTLATSSSTGPPSLLSTPSQTTPSQTPTPPPIQSTPNLDQQSQGSTFVTTSNGQQFTITQTLPSSGSPTASSAPAKSFLQNKPLAGTVFGLAGLVGLVLLIVLSTFAIRRQRRNKLEHDAESFDDMFAPQPGALNFDSGVVGANGLPGEKRRNSGGQQPTRSASGRTASTRERGGSLGGSEEGLLGGGGSTYDGSRTLNDVHEVEPVAPQMAQLGQPIVPRYGPDGFNPLPAPPRSQQAGIPPKAYSYDNAQRTYAPYQPSAYSNVGNGPVATPGASYIPARAFRRGSQTLPANTSPTTNLPSPWDARGASPTDPFTQQHQPKGSQGSQNSQQSNGSYGNNNQVQSGGYGYGSPPVSRNGVATPASGAVPPSPSVGSSSSQRWREGEHRPSGSDATRLSYGRPLSNIFGNGMHGNGSRNNVGDVHAHRQSAGSVDEDAYAEFAYSTASGPLKVANA